MTRIILFLLLFLTSLVYAGDYHQADSTHTIVYTVSDASGNHVAGETVRLTLYRPATNQYYDFSDNTWKNLSSVTTLHRTLNENATSGIYFSTVTIDTSTMISADVVITVSNDSGVYGDLQSESVYFDRIKRLIKINR